MTQHDTDERVRALVTEAYASSEQRFDAGFADRVMHRLGHEAAPSNDIASALARQSRRVLPALIAASLALAAWNISATRGTAGSLVVAALGLKLQGNTETQITFLEGAEAFQ